jgi:hypothetical protein
VATIAEQGGARIKEKSLLEIAKIFS